MIAYKAALEGWARALNLRDRKIENHTQRVTDLIVRLARFLRMDENVLVHIRRGALLHDIGKNAIPGQLPLKWSP